MIEATFTPGPWKVESLIQARVARTVITAMDPTDGPGDPPWELATVWPRVGYDDDQSPANARLMASAPDMLEVLKRIAEHTDPDSPEENYRADDPEGCLDTVFSLARNAIRKATTGEPTP